MDKTLRRLDSIHQKLMETVTPLEPKLFSQPPAEGQWSVAEIVHHLRLVEDLVVKNLQANIARPPQRVGLLRRLIPTSIVSMRLVRVKAPKAAEPFDAPEKEIAIENLNQSRNSLKELCATHGKDRLRSLIFKHPVLGDIDGVAAVSFVGYHEKRHYKQIREAVRKLES